MPRWHLPSALAGGAVGGTVCYLVRTSSGQGQGLGQGQSTRSTQTARRQAHRTRDDESMPVTGARSPSALEKLEAFGLPTGERVTRMDGFVSCVDGRTRTPKWVHERLTKDSVRGEGTTQPAAAVLLSMNTMGGSSLAHRSALCQLCMYTYRGHVSRSISSDEAVTKILLFRNHLLRRVLPVRLARQDAMGGGERRASALARQALALPLQWLRPWPHGAGDEPQGLAGSHVGHVHARQLCAAGRRRLQP